MNREGKMNYRYHMVKLAQESGIKGAAKAYQTYPSVVRRWVKRYESGGMRDLMDRSSRPKHSPNKCDPALEAQIIDIRSQTKNKYGARRLIERYELGCGKSCIQRIINENPSLRRAKKTRTKKKNNLWSIKKLMKIFEKIQVDVKVLTDIPNYYSASSRLGLPKYEFTARCVKTGASFICYARRNNSSNAATFITYIAKHLEAENFDVKEITFQMDNGAEFFACGLKKKGKTPVESLIEDHLKATIHRIPPASPTFNSDVETFHRLVEDEFYDIEDIESLTDLIEKSHTYLVDFNYIRKNSYKDHKTPYELGCEDIPILDVTVFDLVPIVLDDNQHLYYNTIEDKTESLCQNHQHDSHPLAMDSLDDWGIENPNVGPIPVTAQGGQYVSGLDNYSIYSQFKFLSFWEQHPGLFKQQLHNFEGYY